MAAELSIFKIVGEPTGKGLESYLESFPELRTDLEKRMFLEVYRVAGLGQSAARSMAPVRHFELLNSIDIKLDSSLQARVVVSETHRSSPTTNDQLFNPQLAQILDEGKQRATPSRATTVAAQLAGFSRTNPRSRILRKVRKERLDMFRKMTTPSIDGFPSGIEGQATKDWIKDAQKNLTERLKRDGK